MADSSKISLPEQSKEFPHDLDSVLDEIGKSGRKQNVVEALKDSLKKELDYIAFTNTKCHKYYLSNSCFLEIKKRVSALTPIYYS